MVSILVALVGEVFCRKKKRLASCKTVAHAQQNIRFLHDLRALTEEMPSKCLQTGRETGTLVEHILLATGTVH